MKKLFFTLIVSVIFNFSGIAQNNSNTKEKDQASKIHIEFGRKSKNCGGFGICKFTIDITIEELAGILGLKTSNNGIKLNFTKDFYVKNESYFNSGFLILEEDFSIDKETSFKLGFKEIKTLKQGKYPVTLDKSTNTYNCYLN